MLIADASPAFATGTEPMRVVVSGATTSVIPIPNSSTYGRMSTSVDSGGSHVDGSPSWSAQGSVVTGTRASQNSPRAMMTGPMTRNGRMPIRPAALPTRAENSVRMMPVGRPMIPAAVAV